MKRRIWNTIALMIFVGSLALMAMALIGCSHDLYQPAPYQSVRLVGDVRATVTFPVKMSDGTVQMVVTGTTLKDGSLVKQLSSSEEAAYQAALAKDLAANQLAK
jgi:hypothetical protein